MHQAFSGLNDRQIGTFYSDKSTRHLQPGESLFSEGEQDVNTYLIVSGLIQVQQTREQVIYPLTQIYGNGHISPDIFSDHGIRNASAIAQQPVTAIVINELFLQGIDQDIQIILYRNLQRSLTCDINTLHTANAQNQYKIAQMSQELTGMLLGKSDQYSGSAAVQNLLKRVPKLPPYASQLTGLLLSDDVSARDVTELAKLDPSLTGAVLKTVNSAYYGLSQKVSNFHHAALLLGFNQIYQVILNLGIQKTMPDTGQFKRLQAHSVLISILCFEISQATRSGNGPVMNTIGLLHDIGKSVLLLLISQNPKLAFFISLLDPARIGAMLLNMWEIPEEIVHSLEYQKYPELLPPEMIPESCRRQVSILYLAHLCLDQLSGKAKPGNTTVFLRDYLEELGIREKNVEDFVSISLLPSIKKRLPTYPAEVQTLFTNAMTSAAPTGDTHSTKPLQHQPETAQALG